MNIDYINNKFNFNLRTSALIFNKNKDKILFSKIQNRDFYLLLGGRIKELEKSYDAIKREIIEELGNDYSNLDYEYVCTSEEFVNAKGYNNHQINIIYKSVYNKDIKENVINGLEGDWITFEWINIKDIDNINIYPNKIKEIMKGNNINHIIEDLIGDNNGII